MKRLSNPVIPDYTPKKDRAVKDEGLPLKPCLICSKLCQPYGMWSDGQTCTSKCEKVKESQPKYQGGQSCTSAKDVEVCSTQQPQEE